MDVNGAIWIAWPKKTARNVHAISADMSEDRVREAALPRGLVDDKVCAIDDTRSGLRLVLRKENRITRLGSAPARTKTRKW